MIQAPPRPDPGRATAQPRLLRVVLGDSHWPQPVRITTESPLRTSYALRLRRLLEVRAGDLEAGRQRGRGAARICARRREETRGSP